MRDIYELFWIGAFASFILTSSIWIILYNLHKQPDILSCREGKLYEVSYEGNITVFDPTYNDCEVAK